MNTEDRKAEGDNPDHFCFTSPAKIIQPYNDIEILKKTTYCSHSFTLPRVCKCLHNKTHENPPQMAGIIYHNYGKELSGICVYFYQLSEITLIHKFFNNYYKRSDCVYTGFNYPHYPSS